jgi:hypothetical protein
MKKIFLGLLVLTAIILVGIMAFGQSVGPIAESTSASKSNYMYSASHQFCYDATSTSWRWVNVIDNQADGQAATLNGQVTSSIGYGYNGTTFDMLRVGASNELQTTDVANRPGEDAANDWRKIKKEQTATYTPAYTDTSITGGAGLTISYAATEVMSDVNWCFYIKNTDGADAFTDVEVDTSPNNSDWIGLSFTTCDSLAAGSMCTYCVTGSAYRYARVRISSTNDTSSRVWYTANKG